MILPYDANPGRMEFSERTGSFVSSVLEQSATPHFVIEDNDEVVKGLKARAIEAASGNAADPEAIATANLGAAHACSSPFPTP